MPIKLNQDDLLKLLNSWKLEPTFQPVTAQVYIVMKIRELEVPVFFGIRSENTLLQTIAYLPYRLQKNTLNEVARVLHLLNKELDVPGFGLDEKENLMFYRTVILCPDQELNEKVLELHLATGRVAVESFMGAIEMIATGKKSVEDLYKKSNG